MFLEACAQLLAEGCAVRFRAEGTSMLPTIADGELLLVAPAAAAAVRRGDILLCRCPAGAVAHRVTEISRDPGGGLQFRLRGDGKLGCDAPVAAAAVLGRVVAVSRNGRLVRLGGPAARYRRAFRAAATALRLGLGLAARRARAVPAP